MENAMSCHSPRIRSLNAKNFMDIDKHLSSKDKPTFTSQLLIYAFNKISSSSGKAPGPDGISIDSHPEWVWGRKLSKTASSIRELVSPTKLTDSNESNKPAKSKPKPYTPGPTRPARIPKLSGGFREIRISNTVDRVVNRACLEVMNPFVDKNFLDWNYGFRPKRSHNQILEEIAKSYKEGFKYACHYDIIKAFDNVPIRHLLQLIRGLEIKPDIKLLAETLIVRNKPERFHGLSQGDALSGLLFNIYVHSFHDIQVNQLLTDNTKIFRYADDLCVLATSKEAAGFVVSKSNELLNRCGFRCEVNPVVNLNEKNISVLGLTMAGDGHNIRFTLTDSSWSQLRESLDEAHNHPDPVNLSRLIVSGWKNASKPVIWSSEETNRLNSLLEEQGFKPTTTRSTLQSRTLSRIGTL
jgi:retron-type reverse transcriptase